jgi:hypothetical protein
VDLASLIRKAIVPEFRAGVPEKQKPVAGAIELEPDSQNAGRRVGSIAASKLKLQGSRYELVMLISFPSITG